MSRIIAIGDIHGLAHVLQELVDKLDLVKTDTVISAGDLCDRGQDPHDVIEIIKDVGTVCNTNVVMGNHDFWALKRAADFQSGQPIMFDGFLPSQEDATWMRQRPVGIKVGNLCFTHAGVHPDAKKFIIEPYSNIDETDEEKKLGLAAV